MIELTEQQRQELNADPPRVLDPQTKKTYVLVSEEVYERMQALLAPERLPRIEQQALLHAAGLRGLGRSGNGNLRLRSISLPSSQALHGNERNLLHFAPCTIVCCLSIAGFSRIVLPPSLPGQ